MTEPLDLAGIEARRDTAYADGSWDDPEWRDIIALLAEVQELRAKVKLVEALSAAIRSGS